MREWLILGGIVFLAVVLPIVASMGFFGETLVPIGKGILAVLLVLILMPFTGIFGYICVKAQARKWGTSLLTIAVLGVIAGYLLAEKVTFTTLLVLATAGSGFLAYVSFKDEKKILGAGLFVIAALCLVAIYWLIMGHLPFF